MERIDGNCPRKGSCLTGGRLTIYAHGYVVMNVVSEVKKKSSADIPTYMCYSADSLASGAERVAARDVIHWPTRFQVTTIFTQIYYHNAFRPIFDSRPISQCFIHYTLEL